MPFVCSSVVFQADSLDDLEKEAAAWAPRSPDELTLELQLACVHPRVCALAASARIGVPDPEDAFSPLPNKKARYCCCSSAFCFSPHKRKTYHVVLTPANNDLCC